MIASGLALAMAPSSVPTSPSLASARIGLRQHLRAGLELRRDLVEHRLHDRRHAGHGDDIADPEAGRAGHFVGDQRGALRNARHAHARLVELAAGLGERAPA